MKSLKKIRKQFQNKTVRLKKYFFSEERIKMPKKVAKKIYKVRRKEIDDSKDNFVVKFKGLSKQEIKQLRTDIDAFLKDYLEPISEEKSEY